MLVFSPVLVSTFIAELPRVTDGVFAKHTDPDTLSQLTITAKKSKTMEQDNQKKLSPRRDCTTSAKSGTDCKYYLQWVPDFARVVRSRRGLSFFRLSSSMVFNPFAVIIGWLRMLGAVRCANTPSVTRTLAVESGLSSLSHDPSKH